MLSEQQRDLMRHALGLDRKRKPYRNSYAACPEDTATCQAWDDLVARGLASFRPPSDWLPYNMYRVTDAGQAALEDSQS